MNFFVNLSSCCSDRSVHFSHFLFHVCNLLHLFKQNLVNFLILSIDFSFKWSDLRNCSIVLSLNIPFNRLSKSVPFRLNTTWITVYSHCDNHWSNRWGKAFVKTETLEMLLNSHDLIIQAGNVLVVSCLHWVHIFFKRLRNNRNYNIHQNDLDDHL